MYDPHIECRAKVIDEKVVRSKIAKRKQKIKWEL
jgi:hypothetical protein